MDWKNTAQEKLDKILAEKKPTEVFHECEFKSGRILENIGKSSEKILKECL